MEFIDVFEENCKKYSDVPAVKSVLNNQSVTYGELNTYSASVYAYLKKKGIGREQMVFVHLPRDTRMVVAMIGIIKAGAAFILCEDTYPKDRVEFIKKDCSCVLTINETVYEEMMVESPLYGHELTSPHDACFAVYTSGSTGNPKGVLHEYGKLMQMVECIYRVAPIFHVGSTLALSTPFTFVVSLIAVVRILNIGMCLYILPYEIAKDVSKLAKFIEENDVKEAFFSFGVLKLYKDNLYKGLISIYAGGEAYNNISLPEWVCFNGTYCSSESAFLVASYRIDKEYEKVPAGKNRIGVEILILDEDGKKLPDGKIGEICFKNEFTRGYINMPEKTAEAFANGVYHMGDLGYINEDGDLMVSGRKDDMIKIDGNRIEPAEIEAAIKDELGISGVVAKGFVETNKSFICAYFLENELKEKNLLKEDGSFDTEKSKLRETLPDRLPYYMLPTYYCVLPLFPVNANGKLDKKQLKAPDISSYTREYVAPANEMEEKLCNVMAEVLDIERVGVTDDFYELGGNSMSAIRLVTQMNQGSLDINILRTKRTPQKIAEACKKFAGTQREDLEERNTEKAAQDLPFSAEQRLEMKKHPLSQSQLGVFLECLQFPSSTQYNLPSIVKLDNAIDLDRLSLAWQNFIKVNAIYRNRYEIDADGTPWQWSDDNMPINIIRRKCTKHELDAYTANEFVRPYDILSGEPLFRIEIVETEEGNFLLSDIHHTITDGFDLLKIRTKELDKFYQGYTAPIDYRFYELAENEAGLTDTLEYIEARKYFTEKFQGQDFVTLNNTDGFVLGQMLVASEYIDKKSCNEFCKKHSIPIDWLFNLAFCHAIGAITRNEKITYGTIYHGRNTLEKIDIDGIFFNSVAVMADVSGDLSIQEAISGIGKELNLSFANAIYPSRHLYNDIHNIPKIIFNFLVAEYLVLRPQYKIDGCVMEAVELIRNQIHNGINVSIFLSEDKYQIRIESSSALNTKENIAILAKAIKATLHNIMANPEAKLNDIPIVTEEETEEIIKLSAGEKLEYDTTKTWIDMFEHLVEVQGEHLAVVDDTSSFTYAELDKASDAVAEYLIKNGIQKNDFVIIKMDRVKEFIVAVIGIQKAGAAYVPVDIAYPEERIKYIEENSESKVTLTEELVKTIVATKTNAQHINLATPDTLAYVIYTSGSTGKPKGVMLRHGGLLNYVVSYINIFDLTPADRISHHVSFSFDAHIRGVYVTLSGGATLYIMPESIRRNPDEIYNFLLKHDITGGSYATAIGKIMFTEYDLKQRYISVGGEALQRVTGTSAMKIFNVYGPTECTDVISNYPLKPGVSYDTVPIGRPMPNVYAFIVDEYDNLLPKGIVGELCCAGPNVSAGYWKLPEKTEEVFGNCPFVDGLRMYHTGDLARYNADGNLEYVGRIDFQVKLRGFRIELGEIESRAAQYEGINLVVAQVKQERLVLYFTAKENVDKNALKSFMEKTLADYMVPDIFMQLEQMSMTPSGKIDRRALPEPEFYLDEVVIPETALENELFQIVKAQLKLDSFGVTNNLLSLGLSSLGAMKLSATVKNTLNFNLKVADIMKSPTIRALAEIIKANSGEQREVIKHYETREYYPLTENQRGIYIDWEMNRNTTQYNIPAVYKLANKNAEKLAEAVKDAIDVHDSLKTRFALVDGDIMQQSHADETVEISLTELTTEPTINFFQNRVRSFDLFADKLYRAEVYTYNDDVYLFLDIHHILYDGMSIMVLMKDVLKAYDGEIITAEEITSYDFALYERELMGSDAYTEAEAYYDNLMSDSNVARYLDSAQPDGINSATLSVEIPAKDINAACAKYGVTVASFLNAALAETLHRITHEENPMYLTISTGREADARLTSCVGMFVKTLPVVLHMGHLTGNVTVGEFVIKFHEELQSTIEKDFYPYTKLVEKYGLRGEIMFVYQGGLAEVEVDISGVTPLPLSLDTVKLPITITTYPDKDNYVISVEYDGNRYAKADMQSLANAFGIAAMSMARVEKIRDISLVSKEEVKKIIKLSAGEKLEYDTTKTWIDMFEHLVEVQGEHLAVVDEISSFTYAELDKASDRVANYLLQNGVQKNDFVVIKMDRVKEFVAAAIGIQKAGAAYVPVDIAYPKERIKYIEENCETKVILTEELVKTIVTAETNVPRINLATPDTLAYMIYTSGSTGKPKGAMIPQSAFMNFTHFICLRWHLSAESRISCHCSFAFDASVEDLYPVLTVGGSVHIISEETRRDIILMREYIKTHGITGGNYSTQFGQLLGADDILDLDYINLGGEKMTSIPKTTGHIYNTYGPTEFTDDATYFEVKKDVSYTNIPIGRPLYNCSAFIMDMDGHLLPKGTVGELCLAGPQLAKGYWKLPEKTAEVFKTVNIDGKDVAIYRTGDLARYNADGNLEYVGRIDFQVKLRGFRIELGEIESRAAQYEGINLVVAQVKQDRLVLYFTAKENIDTNSLKSFMAKTLTDYMVPDIFMQLEQMPMTPSGKIDHRALPEPKLSNILENIAPANAIEEQVLRIAKELLPNIEFGVTDDLKFVGLNSIKAMKLTARIDSELSLKIRVSNIMRYRTIRGFLTGDKNISWFYQKYDATKPTLVLIHGLLPIFIVSHLYSVIDKYFNLFIIEPTDNHYKEIFEGKYLDEVVDFYYLQIKTNLPKDADIFAFMGFSFGGELAFMLADRWVKATDKKPVVIMGDTILTGTQNLQPEEIEQVILTQEVIELYQKKISEWGLEMTEADCRELAEKEVLNRKMVSVLQSKMHMSSYSGYVILLNALLDCPATYIEKKLTALERYAEDYEVIDFQNADHYGLYMLKSLEPFYDELFARLLKEYGKR